MDSGTTKKLSSDSKQMEKELEVQRKVMNALFEEELVGEKRVGLLIKKEIALVTEIQIEDVKEVFKKAEIYRKMHRMLRAIKLAGGDLPQSLSEMQHLFSNSKYQYTKLERRQMAHKQENNYNKGYMRAYRLKVMRLNAKRRKQRQ
jgi:hypothetical protein